MSFDLSYAQNLEDYYLAEAFAGQARGFYIDVGAGHPVFDNVSCWFYLQGWQGIVVEPQQNLLDLYRFVRPRDTGEACVLGRAVGEVDFYAVEQLHGFSSIMPESAAQAVNFGATFKTERVAMKTLAALCAEHGVKKIDFLKIDVEGAEGEVLAGGDFRRWRPRVILLEAMAPGTLAANWDEWERLLLHSDYDFVLFDGLNRYYVAKEDTNLLDRFPRDKVEWLVVPHLGHTNRAPLRDDHPDHPFAKRLVENFLAELPLLPDDLILKLVLRDMPQAELERVPTAADKAAAIARLFPGDKFPHASAGLMAVEAESLRELYVKLIATDQFRILKGRIAASYDGGQILVEE